jgi:hypothetical protein
MRHVSRALLAGGLGLAAAFLAACGAGSGLLSSSQASALIAEVNQATSDVSNGDCTNANTILVDVQTKVAGLPASVNPTLVSDLDHGADTLRALANEKCSGSLGVGSDNTTTSVSTPTTTHPDTTSTPTSTTTTSTETNTQSTPSTPSTPATTTSTPGTTTTGGGGGAGLPGNGGSGNGTGVGQGGGSGNGPDGGPGN